MGVNDTVVTLKYKHIYRCTYSEDSGVGLVFCFSFNGALCQNGVKMYVSLGFIDKCDGVNKRKASAAEHCSYCC